MEKQQLLDDNRYALIGFVISFLGPLAIVGFIFSVIGLVKANNYIKKRELLAVFGICISIFTSILFVILISSISTYGYNYNYDVIDYSNLINENNNNYNDNQNNSEEYSNKEQSDNEYINTNNLKSIENDKLKEEFIKACNGIKMDYTQIKNLKKVDDWNSGPRYTFDYSGEKFVLYGLDNGDVSSITIVNSGLDKIYLDGYESLDVNDFIFGSSAAISLRVKTEEKLKEYIKYPSSAKFNRLEYTYSRRYDIFKITGSFTAKNALDEDIYFVFNIEFKKSDNDYSIVYLSVNNKKYIGTASNFKEIDRKELQKNTDGNNLQNDVFVIKDGALGIYGKKDLFDGEEYIRYYIPSGTYEVEALTKNAGFYIETKEIHKEDGWDTATTIDTIRLTNLGDKKEFSIMEDQCISLIMYTQIKLKKK